MHITLHDLDAMYVQWIAALVSRLLLPWFMENPGKLMACISCQHDVIIIVGKNIAESDEWL